VIVMARDRALEAWLQGQVGQAYDALKANPARAVSAQALRARLADEHSKLIVARTAASSSEVPREPE